MKSIVCRLIAGTLAVSSSAVLAQTARPIDLGHGIYAAIGVAVGAGGGERCDRSGSAAEQHLHGDDQRRQRHCRHQRSGRRRDSSSQPDGDQQCANQSDRAHARGTAITPAASRDGGRPAPTSSRIAASRNFWQYQRQLAGFFASRNAAQFGGAARPAANAPAAAPIEPTKTFDERMTFGIGDVSFDLLHTPGETPDHLTVWIPQYQRGVHRR